MGGICAGQCRDDNETPKETEKRKRNSVLGVLKKSLSAGYSSQPSTRTATLTPDKTQQTQKTPKSTPLRPFPDVWNKDEICLKKKFQSRNGAVHLATVKSNGEEVVVKRLSRRHQYPQFSTIEGERNFHLEFKHDNIIETLGTFEDRKYIYLIMKYEPCGDLFDWVCSENYDFEKGMNFLRQVIQGLIYMHEKRVIHRDLKPENVVISKNGVAKIVDFGFAVKMPKDKSVLGGAIGGTLPYVSPEVVAGKPYDFGLDVWGIGVLAYCIMTRKLPFGPFPEDQHIPEETLNKKITKRIMTCNPRFDPEISTHGKNFLKRVFRKESKHRMKLQGMLKHPFLCKETVTS